MVVGIDMLQFCHASKTPYIQQGLPERATQLHWLHCNNTVPSLNTIKLVSFYCSLLLFPIFVANKNFTCH